jgi:hypothetical protein
MNCPHWLLALTIPFSRSNRAHTYPAGVGAGCSEGLDRTNCFAGESPSVCRRAGEALPTGWLPYQTRGAAVNALRRPISTGRRPGVASQAIVAAGLVATVDGEPQMASRGWRAADGEPWMASRDAGTGGWHAVNHPVLRMPPGARRPTCFPSSPCAIRAARGRAPPVVLLDLPQSV